MTSEAQLVMEEKEKGLVSYFYNQGHQLSLFLTSLYKINGDVIFLVKIETYLALVRECVSD